MAQRRLRLRAPERRASILAAATRVFAERGYQAASIREVAAAAGVTKPLIYDHFGSKKALYVAVIESVRGDLILAGAAVMEQSAPPELRIRTAVDRFFSYVEARPAAAHLLFTAPQGDAEVVAAWQRVQADASHALVALVAAERNLLPDATGRSLQLEVFMEFLKEGLHGLASWWMEHPDVSRWALVDAVMVMIWDGLGSRFRP